MDKLIHIADLHYWQTVTNPLRLLNKRSIGNFNVWLRRRHEFVMTRAEKFAEAVVSTGIQNALLTGDFTSTALDEEFENALAFVRGLSKAGLRVFVMPGNHDVYTFEAQRTRRFERHFAEFLPSGGYPSVEILPGGTPLMLVPTVRANLLSSQGEVTPKTVSRVGELLEGLQEPIIIGAHYPLLSRTFGYVLDQQRRMRYADTLRTALGESGKQILYVSGHVHRFTYVKDHVYPTLQHLTTGAFFRTARETESQGEFCEVHAGEETGVQVIHHRFSGAWKFETVEVRPVLG